MHKHLVVWVLNFSIIVLALSFNWPITVLILFVIGDLFASFILLTGVFLRRLATGDDTLSIIDIADHGVPIDEPSYGPHPFFDASMLCLSFILPLIVSFFYLLIYASQGGRLIVLGATLVYTLLKTVVRVSFLDHQALRRHAAFEIRYFAPFTFAFLFVIGTVPWPLIGFVIYVFFDSLRGWYGTVPRGG